MKFRRTISIMLSLIMLLSSSTIAQATEATIETENEYVIVGNVEVIENIENDYGGEISNNGRILSDIILTKTEVRDIVKENDEITIEENIVFDGDSTDTDETEVNSQWYLNAIGVRDADIPENKVKIAVLDSGVSYTDDITVTKSIKLVDDGNESILFSDASGHGTAVAGIIAAHDNDKGITGVNPYADIYSAQVLDSDNIGTLSAILEAINWAIENEVDIINMSFGTSTDSELLHNAIREAYNAGILIVASAGNSADSAVKYPAAYDEVIAVGGTDASGNICADLTIGEKIDIFAPAEKILSTALLEGVMATGGTSASAAQVTGVASLLLQKDTSKSPDFIKSLIKATAKEIADSNAGFIDYAYANEIYEDFESTYIPGEIPEYTNETQMENYEEDAEIVVEGLWGNGDPGHSELSDVASTYAGGITSYYMNIINYACTHVDDVYGGSNPNSNLGKIQAFHGRGNYIANMRLIFYFAQYIGEGKSLNGACNLSQRKFPDMLVETSTGVFETKNGKNSEEYMLDMVEALREIYNNLLSNNSLSLYNDTTIGPKRRMLVFLGVMLHIVGDVFAHRTIVHSYTVEGVNPSNRTKNTTHADKFGQSDFNKRGNNGSMNSDSALKTYVKNNTTPTASYMYWEDFQQTVRLGVMEFQDVYRFAKSGTDKYDDQATFCKERYSAATTACKKMLNRVIDTNYPDFNEVTHFKLVDFLPTDSYVKLNNLKNFVEQANLTPANYDYDWSIHSTSSSV